MKLAGTKDNTEKDRPMGFFVRPMREEDIPQVAVVEKECFPTGWVATPFKRELRNRMTAYLVACEAAEPYEAGVEARTPPPQAALSGRGFFDRLVVSVKDAFSASSRPVPDISQRIVGYVGIWFMVDEAHITAVGVVESSRRQGIGELLVLATTELAIPRGARVMSLEVRVSNDGAKALYEKYGFRPAGVRKGYYTDNHEDALIMTTEPISTMEYGQRLEELRLGHAERWGESVRLLS